MGDDGLLLELELDECAGVGKDLLGLWGRVLVRGDVRINGKQTERRVDIRRLRNFTAPKATPRAAA